MRLRCLFLLFLPPFVFAQSDTIEGTVVNGITGAAVSGARVLIWKRNGPNYEVDTDPAGRFRIDEVSSGAYSARFDKEGFVPLEQYSNESFQIGGGKQPPAKIELLPFARVRGHVYNPDGAPVANLEVEMTRALRDPKLLSTVTDNEGEFAFDSVAPGSYALRAVPKMEVETGETAATARESQARLEPTYYPSVNDFSQAGRITVQAGTELTGYDIHIQSRPVYRVRGSVLNPDGKPAAHAFVRLIPKADSCSISSGILDGLGTFSSAMPGAEAGVETGDKGAFEFSGVRPGSWQIAASNGMGGGVVSTLVADKDVDELRIQTEPFADFEGGFEWGDQTEATGGEYAMLFLCNLDQQLTFFVPLTPRRTFRLPNLPPGRYRLAPTPYPVHGKTPSAVFLGDRNVLGEEVQLTASSPPMRVVYGTTPGVFEGRVDQGDCAVVLLLAKPFIFPETPLAAHCTAGGKFQITGVAPGNYYAIALDGLDISTPRAPDFLRKLLPPATAITITKGSTSTLDLPASHRPE